MDTVTIIRIKDLDGREVRGLVTDMEVGEATTLVRGVIKALTGDDNGQEKFDRIMGDLGFTVAAETEIVSEIH